jgi:hypothetical protein
MSFTNILKALPAVELDTSTLSEEEFIPINIEGLGEACFLLKLLNNSTTDILISYDKEDVHEFIPGRGAELAFPPTMSEINCLPSGNSRGYCAFPKGKVLWVKGTPGTGNLILMAYFQERV